jgi:hypothetical protein
MRSPISIVAIHSNNLVQKVRILDLASSSSVPSRKRLDMLFGVELAQGAGTDGREQGRRCRVRR